MNSLLAMILLALGAVLVPLVLLMAIRHRYRRNRPLVAVSRLIACVFVQFMAILVATMTIHDPGSEAENATVEQLLEHNASNALMTFLIVLGDIVATVVVGLFKSEWIEPILR